MQNVGTKVVTKLVQRRMCSESPLRIPHYEKANHNKQFQHKYRSGWSSDVLGWNPCFIWCARCEHKGCLWDLVGPNLAIHVPIAVGASVRLGSHGVGILWFSRCVVNTKYLQIFCVKFSASRIFPRHPVPNRSQVMLHVTCANGGATNTMVCAREWWIWFVSSVSELTTLFRNRLVRSHVWCFVCHLLLFFTFNLCCHSFFVLNNSITTKPDNPANHPNFLCIEKTYPDPFKPT